MAPRKSQMHKGKQQHQDPLVDATAWVDNLVVSISDPVLDLSDLWRVYRLDRRLCSTVNDAKHETFVCDLPRCLAGIRSVKATTTSLNKFVEKLLGRQPEPLEDSSEVLTTAVAEQEEQKEQQQRLTLEHRGLRNLGNTCYLNCVLQMMFHIPELRRAVASSTSPAISDSGLGWIFLQMGFARYRTVDPSQLVRFLRLDTHVQQDAQELLGLLLQWLSSNSSTTEEDVQTTTRSSSNLADVLATELEGLQLYIRTCPRCGAEAKKAETFSFLSVLPLTNLLQGLRSLCDEDEVEGFICGQCNETVTAKSAMQFKRLPKTLLIHLTRFRYDVHSDRRIKVDDSITFPTVLDSNVLMSSGPLTGRASSSSSTATASSDKYVLEGVVNHVGNTPQAGHYTYHCRSQNDTWYCMDDAEVLKLRKYAGETAHSREAYVLVYRLATASDNSTAPSSTAAATTAAGLLTHERMNLFPSLCEFPEPLIARLIAEHDHRTASLATYHLRKESLASEVKHWSSLLESVLHPPPHDESSPLYFVSARWLQSFGSMFTSNAHDAEEKDDEAPENHHDHPHVVVDDEEQQPTNRGAVTSVPTFELVGPTYRCPHGKLRLDAPVKAVAESAFCELQERYGSTDTTNSNSGSGGSYASAVAKGGFVSPLTTENGLCATCAVARIVDLQQHRQDEARNERMKQMARVLDVTIGNIVNVDVLEQWLSGTTTAASDPRDLAQDLVCPHGHLSPSAPRRVVAADVFRYLIAERGYVCSHSFDVTTESCVQCFQQSVSDTSARHSMRQRRFEEAKLFPTLLTNDRDINRAIWKRNLVQYAKKHRAQWEEQRAKKLQQTEKAAADAAAQSAAVVLVVKHRSGKKSNGGKQQENEEVAEEVPPPPTATAESEDVYAPRRVAYTCVPWAWVEAWRAWYHHNPLDASSGALREAAPPGPVDTAGCLCPHGKLLFDVKELRPPEPSNDASTVATNKKVPPLVILNNDEYAALMEVYGPCRGPTISFIEMDEQRLTSPEACAECAARRDEDMRRRTLEFHNGIIHVEGTIRRSKRTMEKISETLAEVDCNELVETLTAKLSSRILEHHQLFVDVALIHLFKSKSSASNYAGALTSRSNPDHEAVAKEFGAYNGKESLLDVGITNNLTIHVNVPEGAIAVVGHSAVSHVESSARSGTSSSANAVAAAAEVAAFGATRLAGLQCVAAPKTPSVKECTVCTFHNPLSAKVCEMCESRL